ncbi:ATP-dependent RNA helicase DbpA [archaeon BMS3Bbin15]|nr:ATP-dependent RNA helicase DbpA [archaeon BMS3Bbin15]
MFIKHPLIREETIEARLYQETIVAGAVRSNTLVVAPTALGKTIIGVMVAVYRLQRYPESKILMLATTRPLVNQHAESFKNTLNVDKVEVFTGTKKPSDRIELWNNAEIIVATPQVIHNDLLSDRYSLEDVSLVIFDEAHRATGNYPYAFIAGRYMKQASKPLILALTASPGGDEARIKDVIENLFIENIEVRTESDSDVRPFIKGINIEWVRVSLPEEIKPIKSALEKALETRLEKLRKLGISVTGNVTKRDLLMIRGNLQARLLEERIPELYEGLSLIAACINLTHAMELLETQGLNTLLSYFRRVESEASSKAVKGLLEDTYFLRAIRLTENLVDEIKNPKIEKIKQFLVENIADEKKAIIFTQYRDTAAKLVEELNLLAGIRVMRFVGQSKRSNSDKGMTQKNQLEVLESFRKGEVNVLVATSVAEEGLDIPGVDLVIFYEPVPSEIRTIQRRGRTGRSRAGKTIVLIARNTRDEAFYWGSTRKEKKMYEILQNFKNIKLKNKHENQKTLENSIKKRKISIVVDTRELFSSITRELLNYNIISKPKRLEVGDYVISRRLCIERKTTEDFINSLIDGRLMSQAINLRQSYSRALMIVEGESLYTIRNIRVEAVMGALISLTVDFNIPVLFTKNEKETAVLISRITEREQNIEENEIQIRAEKKPVSLSEMQEFVVAGLPNINTTLARRLLEHFGSVERIFSADEKELDKVQGIGKKIAKEMREVISSLYKKD